MKIEEYIRGIPSGLLTAQLGEREIQVVGISENGFEFRLEKKAARQLLTDAVPAQHSDTVLQGVLLRSGAGTLAGTCADRVWAGKSTRFVTARAQGKAVRSLLLSALSGLRNFAGVSDCCAEASFTIYPLHPSEAGRG